MTLVAAIMRNLSAHSSLADIVRLHPRWSILPCSNTTTSDSGQKFDLDSPPFAVAAGRYCDPYHVQDQKARETRSAARIPQVRRLSARPVITRTDRPLYHSELDALNTGNRELSGEWVVNKTVWARLKAEKMERDRQKLRERERRGMGQGRLSFADGPQAQAGEKAKGEKIIYYIHGGESFWSARL